MNQSNPPTVFLYNLDLLSELSCRAAARRESKSVKKFTSLREIKMALMGESHERQISELVTSVYSLTEDSAVLLHWMAEHGLSTPVTIANTPNRVTAKRLLDLIKLKSIQLMG